MKERAVAIQGHALDAAEFPIDILDTAFAFDKLFVLTRLTSLHRKKQGTLEALGAIARGMIELDGGMHGQTDGTTRSAISQASKGSLGWLSERDSSDAVVTSSGFMDIPRIVGRITDEVSWELIESDDGLVIERAERRDIIFVEWLGLFGEHDRTILVNG